MTTPPPPLVVCVDDEPEVLSALKRTLRGEPYEVRTTDAPLDAVGWLRREAVAVLLADQRMPMLRGTELLQIAKDVSPSTARVLLTAYPGDSLIVQGLGLLDLCLIGKPWDDDQLRKLIRGLLPGSRDATDP